MFYNNIEYKENMTKNLIEVSKEFTKKLFKSKKK